MWVFSESHFRATYNSCSTLVGQGLRSHRHNARPGMIQLLSYGRWAIELSKRNSHRHIHYVRFINLFCFLTLRHGLILCLTYPIAQSLNCFWLDTHTPQSSWYSSPSKVMGHVSAYDTMFIKYVRLLIWSTMYSLPVICTIAPPCLHTLLTCGRKTWWLPTPLKNITDRGIIALPTYPRWCVLKINFQ